MAGFDLDRFLPYQLAVAARRVSDDFAALYRERFGISIPEWRVLAHLSQEDSVSVREIQKRVDMDKSKVSRAATRLEQNGLIAKRINPADRRLVELSLTPDGQALMAELVPLARAYEDQVLKLFGIDAIPFRAGLETYLSAPSPETPKLENEDD